MNQTVLQSRRCGVQLLYSQVHFRKRGCLSGPWNTLIVKKWALTKFRTLLYL